MYRVRYIISGLVQGVGFRPFVFTIANELNLTGFVLNSSKGVVIELQGERVAQFEELFWQKLPPLARVDTFEKNTIHVLLDESEFKIIQSQTQNITSVAIMPDMSICEDCLIEMKDPKNRRFGYEFINCTNCGPRYSIIECVPYDRENTTMKNFTMCKACKAEYENPDRKSVV